MTLEMNDKEINKGITLTKLLFISALTICLSSIFISDIRADLQSLQYQCMVIVMVIPHFFSRSSRFSSVAAATAVGSASFVASLWLTYGLGLLRTDGLPSVTMHIGIVACLVVMTVFLRFSDRLHEKWNMTILRKDRALFDYLFDDISGMSNRDKFKMFAVKDFITKMTFSSVIILWLFFWVSKITSDWEWFARSGALLVVLGVVMAARDLRAKLALLKVPDRQIEDALFKEVGIIIVGTLVWGFGDLISIFYS